ncbi:MAG: carboxypeptidase regulatory-like domain-containing protein [Thermoanaerobaculia bacterium]
MRFISRIFLSLVLLTVATAARAQETGSISGHVTDSTGLAVPGATVKVSGPQLPAGRTSVTTASGGYNFQRLLPGSYKVEAALQGLGNAASTATVSVDKDTQVALKLISRTATEVVVTAEAIQVDKKSAEVGTSYSSREIKELPLARTYSGLLQLVPGAPDPTVAGTIVGVSIAGGTRQDSKYEVDGVDITNPGYGTLNIQTNDIDIVDFDVKLGGISAEFGRTSGAMINAVTKSGTNDYHGVARFEAVPATFIANQTGTTTTQKIDSYTGAAGLGFPLVKDTLFGYVSGRYFSSTASGQSSLYGTQPDTKTQNQDYFGKVTGNLGSALLVNASVRALPTKTTNSFNSLDDAATAGYNTDVTNWVGNATASWFLSNNSFLEAKYIHLTENDTSQAQTVVPSQPGIIDPKNLGAFGAYADPARSSGNSGIAEFADTGDSYKRDEIRLSASQFLDLGPTQHQIKVGGAYENDDYTLVRQTNGWGSFVFATCPKGVCDPNGSVTGTIRARYYTLQPTQTGKGRTYSAFLQDNVTWSRLSVNLGVLVNKDDFAQVALDGTRYNFMTFNWDQEIQPRLGVAYNSDLMSGDKFYGSYGRYANLDQKSTSRSFAPFRIRQDYAYFSGTTGAFLGNQVRGSSSGKLIPSDLKPPYYDELMAGYEAPIANVLSANVYYQYRSLHQAFEDRPIDPNNYNGAFEAANIPGASKIYRGYTLELNKRLADRWAASLSYTYSQLTGNFDEDYGIELFNTSSILEDGPGVNSAEPNRYGTLSNDRPHILKAFATYDTPFGITLGGYYRYQSGTPWQATGVDAVSGGALRYLEPAGSRRLPGWSNFDLLAAYNFRFGGAYNLRLEGRVLNVFNTQAPLTVNREEYLDPYVDGNPPATLGPQGTTRPNPLFGQYTSYSQPRRFMATLIFEF